MEAVEEKVCGNVGVVEVKVETHDYQIKSLFKAQKNVNERLSAIELTLKRIWWTASGGLLFFIFSEMGLITTLKFIS
jgi:hypothetical protein